MSRGQGHRDPVSPMPQNVNMAKILNKEKSYKKYFESQCSDQWRKHLELTLSDPPGRGRDKSKKWREFLLAYKASTYVAFCDNH